MRYTDLDKFVKENNLLQEITTASGIYAITVDDAIVYVGQSINTFQRCSQHIYGIENAMFNQEKKYLLLLAAKLGGHKVDCKAIHYCSEEELTYWENFYMEQYNPCLNIMTPHGRRDINKMKIEDLLNNISQKEN